MVVLGIAIGAGLVFRGRYLAGVVMAAIFFAIPLLTQTDIPWNIFGPMILIGIGVVALVKAFVLREKLRGGAWRHKPRFSNWRSPQWELLGMWSAGRSGH